MVSFISACTSGLPGNVLPPDRMQPVMWDLMRADEMADYYSGKDSSFSRWTKHAGYYQQILHIHHISQEQLRTSLQFYQNHPSLLQTILDSLQNKAEKQKRGEAQKPSYPVDTSKLKKRVLP